MTIGVFLVLFGIQLGLFVISYSATSSPEFMSSLNPNVHKIKYIVKSFWFFLGAGTICIFLGI